MKATEKNLRASVPPVLLAQAQKAAQRQHITLDELVSDAVEERVNRQEFEEMLAFGKRHAKKRGLKPGDAAAAIAAVRSHPAPRHLLRLKQHGDTPIIKVADFMRHLRSGN